MPCNTRCSVTESMVSVVRGAASSERLSDGPSHPPSPHASERCIAAAAAALWTPRDSGSVAAEAAAAAAVTTGHDGDAQRRVAATASPRGHAAVAADTASSTVCSRPRSKPCRRRRAGRHDSEVRLSPAARCL
jgi:hypothetical protein